VLSEEGVHEILGKVLGEHGELRNVEFRVGGPLKVILRQPPKITLTVGYSCKEGGRVEDGLLLEFPCTPTRTRSV
jgi:hypothetical protein